MDEKFTPDMLEHKLSFSSIGKFSSSALKLGCLLMGLGLLIGYLICTTTLNGYAEMGNDHFNSNLHEISLQFMANAYFYSVALAC